jgi:hypothetical protein
LVGVAEPKFADRFGASACGSEPAIYACCRGATLVDRCPAVHKLVE